MLKRFQLSDGKVCAGDGAIWIYTNPDEAERRYLIDSLKVDEHTLNSALDPDELPRLEFEPEHVALIVKRPKNFMATTQFMFKVGSMGVFLFRDRLVAVISEDVQLFDGRQFNRVANLNELMLKVFFRLVTHYFEHLKVINQITDDLEHKVQTAMENQHLLKLFSLEKSLVFYVNALHSNAGLFEKLKLNAAKLGLTPEQVELLDDLLIDNNQCTKQAEIYSNILASLMDARASIVSNNLNVLMKTLNLITIGIMVPTLVVSIFSMNVSFPMEKWAYPWAFVVIMGLAIASVVVFMFIWRYRRPR